MARSQTVTLRVEPGTLTLHAQSLRISLTRTTIKAGESVGVICYFVYDSATAGVQNLPDKISVPLKIYVNGELEKQVEAEADLTGIGYITPGGGREVDLTFTEPGTYQIFFEIPDTVTVSPLTGVQSAGSIRSTSITVTVTGETERRARGIEVPWEYYLALGLAGATALGIVGYIVYHELRKPSERFPF